MNSTKNSIRKQNYSFIQLSDCIKILSADAVQAANSGHPGLPLGFSDVMTCLAFKFLRFNPHDAKWFNRDRLILSAGHGSMLLYSFFYLTGYKNFDLEDIKNFRQLGSRAAGHPENFLFDGIETSTGPLGQGLANAVGMAIAAKKYQAKLGKNICDHKIYVIVGDGCLMEGISYEALSLAGHLKLDNLIVLFDDNNISIDGKTDLCVSENHLMKMNAFGFNAISADGHDSEQICSALEKAQNAKAPSFIAFKTKIGKGAKTKEGSEKSHGSPLGTEEIKYLKSNISYAGDAFYIPDDVKEIWENAWKRCENDYNNWHKEFALLSLAERKYLDRPIINFARDLASGNDSEATRVSSGKIVEHLMQDSDKIIVGSADLAASNGLMNSNCNPIVSNDFSGNFLYYGVREHAMAGIMNGLALSNFLPLGGTFFVFADYMRPAIRLAALMSLPVIYVMTHDSIGVGEDGPTHQPIEHLASFRAMPNINLFRPADFRETKECYELALKSTNKPSMLVLSRQNLPQLAFAQADPACDKGGYIISESSNAGKIDFTIFSSGSEVSLAIDVQKILANEGCSVRVCSVPCFNILLAQGRNYLNELKGNARHIVAIEAACSFGWASIIGEDGIFFGIEMFGTSAPAADIFNKFGLRADIIAKKLMDMNKIGKRGD